MASAAQISANQANALQSTGPRTESGKARSKHNALRHGLTSAQVVLPHENEEEFLAMRDSLVASLAPENEHEQALAFSVAAAYWRMQRLYRLEVAFMESRAEAMADASPDLTDPDKALALVFSDPAELPRTRLLLRYVTAAERAYYRAVADFQRTRKQRPVHDAEHLSPQPLAAKPVPSQPDRVRSGSHKPASGNGLVSHTAREAASKPAPGLSATKMEVSKNVWVRV